VVRSHSRVQALPSADGAMGGRLTTNLLIRVDPRARPALQRQIYLGVRDAIPNGIAPPGTRLPSSRGLVHDLGVSRTTAALALEQLRSEGYLSTRRGAGTFVATDLPDDLPPTRSLRPAPAPRPSGRQPQPSVLRHRKRLGMGHRTGGLRHDRLAQDHPIPRALGRPGVVARRPGSHRAHARLPPAALLVYPDALRCGVCDHRVRRTRAHRGIPR
jgi:DNA-binding transcriptional regulator YhcF (GntR family)